MVFDTFLRSDMVCLVCIKIRREINLEDAPLFMQYNQCYCTLLPHSVKLYAVMKK